MKTEKIFLAILVLGLTFASCKKGDTGAAGKDGTNGTNGAANVSSTILTANSWSFDNVSQGSYNDFTNVATLTQNSIDKGAIMVYEDLGGGEYVQLPYTLPASGVTLSVFFTFSLNQITIGQQFSDGTDPSPSTTNYRLVVIPPAMRKANVNYSNYNEVKLVHNITE